MAEQRHLSFFRPAWSTGGFKCDNGGVKLEFTKAFDNMPVSVIVIKRNLEKNIGFEEVYLNDALKKKKSLIAQTDNNILYFLNCILIIILFYVCKTNENHWITSL